VPYPIETTASSCTDCARISNDALTVSPAVTLTARVCAPKPMRCARICCGPAGTPATVYRPSEPVVAPKARTHDDDVHARNRLSVRAVRDCSGDAATGALREENVARKHKQGGGHHNTFCQSHDTCSDGIEIAVVEHEECYRFRISDPALLRVP
jgi:hypothetical protein